VRELANVLERSAILADTSAIDADDLALLPKSSWAVAPARVRADDHHRTSNGTRSSARWRRLAATAGRRRRGSACRSGRSTTSSALRIS